MLFSSLVFQYRPTLCTKNYNCLFTKLFAHCRPSTCIFSFPPHLFSLATYLGKLSRLKYHEFSLKLLTFSMLRYQDINCKTVTILFYLLIIQCAELYCHPPRPQVADGGAASDIEVSCEISGLRPDE